MPLLLGHRGTRASSAIPENSIASFELALQNGCDGFEFDVRLTQDGYAVVCHDPKVRNCRISNVTRGRLPELATLDDVLSLFSSRAFLNIELKVAGLDDALAIALINHPPQKGLLVSSFLPSVLSHLHELDPRLPLGIICDRHVQLARWRDMPGQNVIVEKHLITRALVEDVHALGHKILAWTVNDRRSMLRLAGFGIDGMISDNTGLLVSTLRAPAS